MIKEAIAKALAGSEVDAATMEQAVETIWRGEATPAQIAGFLIAMRAKGETPSELAAAARVMRRHALAVALHAKPPVLDTCGTGGDGSGSFNISTASAIVAAAAGVTVAKHGNRAASSQTGSADVLEALGIDPAAPSERVARCIDEVGIGFLFARAHHPAMRHAAPVRAELGVRTLLNFLGPLTNPAGATHQLLGIGDGSKLATMADVLRLLGTTGAWVVHGDDGLDEVSVSGPTRVIALEAGQLRNFVVEPVDFGVERADAAALKGGDAQRNAAIIRAVLAGERGPQRDAVVINAAAALCASGIADSPRAGADRAAAALDSGAAQRKLDTWVAFMR